MTNTVELTVNGRPQQVDPGTTIAGLIEQLQLDRRQVAVEVNQELVPREQHSQRELVAGDCIEVVTLVGGG